MRKNIARAPAALAIVSFALGLTASATQAQPKEINIGPIIVCKVVTFFDTVIFEYDCYTAG